MSLKPTIKKTASLLFLTFAALSIMSLEVIAANRDLVIFHTNDVHGYAFEERNAKGELTRIGYDRLKTIVDQDKSPRKLLIDAGDVLHGQSFATAPRGELISLVLGLIGYDALAVGNHDFNYGQERLNELIKKYRLNFLAANISPIAGKGSLSLPGYLIKDFGDLKVGIFGLTTPETLKATDPRNTAGLSFDDPIATAESVVSLLKDEGADLIIAVTHMGSEPYCEPTSLEIAERVPSIDLIIDGHSHSELGVTVKNAAGRKTLVVSGGAHFQNLGLVEVDRRKGGGFNLRAKMMRAKDLSAVPPNQPLREAMAVLRSDLEIELSKAALSLPIDLDGSRDTVRTRSANMGRVITASMVEATGADAAFLNGGAIKDSLEAGEITKGELLSVLPYGDYVFLIEITGSDLITALNYGFQQPGSGAFPQFWGLEVTARKKAPEGQALRGSADRSQAALEVDSVKIGGRELVDSQVYTLAINDFLSSGGDGYDIFRKYSYRKFTTLEEIFRAFVSSQSPESLKRIADTVNLTVKND